MTQLNLGKLFSAQQQAPQFTVTISTDGMEVSFSNECVTCAAALAFRAVLLKESGGLYEFPHMIGELGRIGMFKSVEKEPWPGMNALLEQWLDISKKLEDGWAKFSKVVQAKKAAKSRQEAGDGPWHVLCSHGKENCNFICKCSHACSEHDAMAGCTAQGCACAGFEQVKQGERP